MTPATNTAPHPNERLERRIAEHKAEVARLRAELGDPQAALSAFVRSRFTIEAFLPDDPSRPDSGSMWWDEEVDNQDAR